MSPERIGGSKEYSPEDVKSLAERTLDAIPKKHWRDLLHSLEDLVTKREWADFVHTIEVLIATGRAEYEQEQREAREDKSE